MIPEIDLHGMTLDEAINEVDRELNHVFIQESEFRDLKFITGWGNVLRPNVKAFLESHPLVKELREEGPSLKVVLEDI